MNKLINKLPIEVIYIIHSFAYKFQPLELRKDIISYYQTKQIIEEFFYHKYSLSLINDKSHYKHLLFHIHSYLTGLPNIYTYCQHKLFNVCKRNYMLKNKSNDFIQPIMLYLFSNHKVDIRFRIYWGLLTVEERDEFIQKQQMYYY